MAGEIQITPSPRSTGSVVYAQVRSAMGTIWRTDTLVFEAYATASIANYAVTMTEQGTASGCYVGTFPTQIPVGVYSLTAFIRAGGAPAETDVLVGNQSTFYWTGTVVSAADAYLPQAQAGAANGALIAGSNAATTFIAFTCTNAFTVSGNWLTTGTTTWTGAAAFSAGLTSDITGTLSTLTTYTGNTPQTGDSFARVGATGSGLTSLASSAQATSIQADTDDIQTRLPAALVGGKMDSTATVTGNVTVGGYAAGQDPFTLVMASAMTEAYTTGAFTLPQALYEIAQTLGQFSIGGTTLTAQKRDQTTTAATFALNDGTNPTARTRVT